MNDARDINIEVGVGAAGGDSSFVVGRQAAGEALAPIRKHALSAVLVHASVKHDLDEVLRGVHEAVGEAPVLGCTTAGEICNGVRAESVVVAAMASPFLRVRCGVGTAVSEGWEKALDQAIDSPGLRPYFQGDDAHAGGLAREGKSVFLMLFSPGNTRRSGSRSFEILERLKQRSLGRYPIVGASSADDWRLEHNYVLHGRAAHRDGLLVAAFETELRFGIASSHGFHPSSRRATVTAAEGHEVLSLDGRVARERMCELLGAGEFQGKHVSLATGVTLGTADPMGQYGINVASYFTERGGLLLTQPVAVGTLLTLMEPAAESMVAAGTDALRKAMIRGGIGEAALGVVNYCALRPRILGERSEEEVAAMSRFLGARPLVGCASFGEQGLGDDGVSRHNNASVSCLVLGAELSEAAKAARRNAELVAKLSAEIEARKRTEEAASAGQAQLEAAVEALRAGEANFHAFFRTIDDIVVVVSPSGRILFANDAFERKLGYSPAEQAAMHVLDVHPPEARDQAREIFASMLRGERTTCPLPFMTKRGESLAAETRAWLGQWNGQACVYGLIKDVSAEQAAQERFERTFHANPALMALQISDERFHDVNDAWLSGLGYTREEVIGRTPSELGLFVRPEDQARAVHILETTGRLRHVELQTRCKDGTILDGLFSGEAFVSQGKLYVVTVMIDVTNLKRAAAALEQESRKNLALIRNASDGIHILDAEGRIVEASDSFCQMLGYAREEVVGMHVSQWDAGFSPDRRDAVFQEQFVRPGRSQFETKHRRKDGRVIDVEVSGYPLELGGRKMLFNSSRDITGRKRAAEKLRESEERYRGIFDESVAAIYVFDAEKRFVDSNQAGLDLLGYSREELLALRIPDVDADPVVVLPAHRELLAGGRLVNFEHRLRRKDGTVVSVLNNSRPLTDSRGIVVGMQSTLIDISDRIRAEETLRAEKERFDKLLQHSSDVSVILGADGTEVYVSASLERITGFRPEECVGRIGFDFVHPDDIAACRRELARLIESPGAIHMLQYRHRTKAGGWVVLEAVGTNRLSDPALNGIVLNVRDITDRRRAEEERTRLVTAMEQAAETVVITDPAGTILYVNQAFERTSGYTRAEAVGKNPRILKSGRHDGKFYEEMWGALRGGQVWQGRLINRRKDGATYVEEATISPVLDGEGRIVNFVAMKLDVTRESLLESQLRQAQKLEPIGRLAGGIAHDFNNMLSVILGYSEVALRRSDVGAQLRDCLEEIHGAARRSANLTRQLLAFARQQPISPKVLDLNQTVGGLLRMLERLIGENIRVDWQPQEGLWNIRMDPSQVDQVLTNLCLNARDAIENAGTISIRTGNLTVDAAGLAAGGDQPPPGDYVRLDVSDDGRGMDEETRSHLFEPFFTTKGVGEGVGLGLATVYGIVKQNNGYINVDGEPGRGTAFTIYLPRFAGAALADALPEAPPASSGRETILLVDDEPSVLKMTAAMLEEEGYTVLSAQTPADAIELAKHHGRGIHLLLTDAIMPEMNGRELSETVLAIRPGLQRLFMSGYARETKGVLVEGAHFIEKPFTVPELLAKVRAILDAEA